ncbi:MAG: helix-turn-helix domain-containing protein [Romboutsia sp.]
MNYAYEIIKFNEALPAKIFIHEVDTVQSHWHESIEILLVANGEVELLIDGNIYGLKENDLIIINSKEIHSIKSNSKDNIVIAVQIDLSRFLDLYENIDKINFKCKSFEHKEDDERFLLIRRILAEIAYNYIKENNGYYIKINSLLYELVYILVNRFKQSTEIKNEKKNYKHLERLNRVISYIQKNYKSDITLSHISSIEYLSPQYFSKFFEKHMGVNFLTYLNSIRLEYAVKDLINTDYNITDIALNNGFPNIKSFTTIFKSIYDETPSSYRKKYCNTSELKLNNEHCGINYLDLNTNKHMEFIFKYLNKEVKEGNFNLEIIDKVENTLNIDINKETKIINNTWKNLITIGKAKEGLIKDVQDHLKEVQSNIGFKYVRFHGIFDDEMMVYGEDKNNKPIFNFVYIDKLFDFLLSIGLKPFVELGFMPSQLVLNKEKVVFYTNSIIGEPKDIKLWNSLLENFIKHCINRYGINEVTTWYFEVWNEPDINKVFGFDNEGYYNELFYETYKTIKAINNKLKIGGPSILGHTILKSDWLNSYINYCKKNGCTPDFITFHSYPIEDSSIDYLQNEPNSKYKILIDKNKNYLKDLINELKSILKQCDLENIEIYMTEWNSTASHRDLTNDTLYKSSYIVKNILENMDSIDGFGYWIATDLLEESRIENDIFHGGLGLITNNGIKKSAFYSYTFLNELGDELIESGDGYFITKKYDTYQLILYNYCHFDNIYVNGDTSQIDKYNRYNVFNNIDKCMNINLENFNPGNYLFKECKITKKQGSAFDTWIEMGHLEYMDEEDVIYINNNSMPKMKKYSKYIGGEYSIRENLSPHEVKIYNIKPIY